MRRIVIPVSALALAACTTVGPDYRAPEAASLAVPEAYAGPAGALPAQDLSLWWEQFDDPLLTRLIDEASAGNLDLAVSSARLTQAREALVQARAGLVPQVGASAGAGRNFGPGDDNSNFNIGADASWEIDLFGRLRRGVEAAGADAEGAWYDREALRTSIAAEVAANYIIARLTQDRLAIARDTLAIADDNLQIAQWRVQAGLASSLDSEQARSARASAAASIPALETSFASATYRLAVLTGRAPGTLTAELTQAQPIPEGPEQIATGIPADTLRQRPDVRSAERNLAAATARVGVAEAQLYPGFRLSGSIGTSAFSLGGLFEAITGSILGGIDQTLFDGGRLRSQLRSQQAATEGALASYRQSVLAALEEVENALVDLQSARQRQQQFAIALDAANNSAILARIQYRSGLTDFQTLLTAERTFLSARDGMAGSRGDEAQALVQLYRALGGGWDASAPPATGVSS
ncbi:efflux transporter outer membrane subunit [Sphingosinicella sp. LHD-64]|uniref:efflux transporter outer membrane subunit n=1 Tax=Sphingosinicella sp. LHD-64 TaxID=3072139 RepID=UPI00280EC6BC|nr:efflux transporter outer membrane subunit [Sphingosinicella sp. LHD-64]MDQ8755761.1 efflux transporter outer membrane subunit [Sphingosinicella sp. LHD-64]